MTYTTVAGDTWDKIAYSVYGDETRAGELMEANPGLLDFFVFPSGVKVVAPETVEDAGVPLPPWMED